MPPSEAAAVATQLREMTNVLSQLVKRVESTEKKVKAIQHRACDSSSTEGASSKSTTRHTVPLIVRVGDNCNCS